MLAPGEEIPLEEIVLRRSYCDPLKKYLNPDGTAHSRVFKVREKDDGKLSVDIRSMTTLEAAILDKTRFILFEISAEEVHEIPPLKTIYDPLPEGQNDAHALILPLGLEDEVTPALLARKSRQARL